jgi:putative ATPase
VIEKAERQSFFDQQGPFLFIDEIHRFSKSQQDSLLSAVESGTITLIGATTENPSFEVISPLLSRCQVYLLNPLGREDLKLLIERALQQDGYLKQRGVEVQEMDALLRFSGGDARKLYNALEITVEAQGEDVSVTNAAVEQAIQQNPILYDKLGEQHYDIASAFIKSIRGSDPNAAVYWLARMVEGGEDEKFICRRMIISAAEDVGLANPLALMVATHCLDAVQAVGFPEARIIMAETAIYLACSPKSNSAYLAIKAAIDEVRKSGNLSVPLHLRNAPTELMKSLDYGKDYLYAHEFEGNFVYQDYLPEEISHSRLYVPKESPVESKFRTLLQKIWKDKYNY